MIQRRRFLAIPPLALLTVTEARAQRHEPLKLTWIGPVGIPFVNDFRAGMRDVGMLEGVHFTLAMLHPAIVDAEAVTALASAALPSTQIFIASGGAVALAIRRATDRVPILGVVSEPVALGLAQNVARPGGNYSGIGIEAMGTGPKSLELLQSGFPTIGRVLLLVETTSTGKRQRELIEAAARTLKLELVEAPVARPEDIDAAAALATAGNADAMLVPASPFFATQRSRLLTLAATLGVPAMYEHLAFAEDGGLICHGPNIAAAFRRLAHHVERIRKGETVSQIPIETVTRLELVINRRTARAQRLVISADLLGRADEVFE